jgi:hypothetical protein
VLADSIPDIREYVNILTAPAFFIAKVVLVVVQTIFVIIQWV